MMPAPLLGDSQGRAGKPTACEDVPKASCSPLEMAKGGSRATTLSTVASMTSSSDTTISLVPSALWGVPTAVMAGPMSRMPAPFEEEPPSLGGREGIGTGVSRRPKGNCRIPSFLYYSYRRKRNNTPKSSTARAGRFLLLCQAGKRVAMQRRLPPAENIGDSLSLVVPIPKTRSALMGHNLSATH